MLQRHVIEFEGRPFTTLTYKDRLAWVAREVGAAIGYARRGKRLATMIRGEWADEFIPDHDYVVLTGEELSAFKAAAGSGVVADRTAGLLLLLEPGVHLVLAKTNKEIGRRLRRFLVDRVLPQIVRTGRYDPDAAPEPAIDVRIARELRLARKLDLDERKFRAASLRQTGQTLRNLGRLDEDVYAACEVAATELAFGAELPVLKLETEPWESPTSLAKRWGITVQRVGRLITAAGVRGDEQFSKRVLNKARGHDRTVTTFVYNEAGVARIEQALRDSGIEPGGQG